MKTVLISIKTFKLHRSASVAHLRFIRILQKRCQKEAHACKFDLNHERTCGNIFIGSNKLVFESILEQIDFHVLELKVKAKQIHNLTVQFDLSNALTMD